eukprot:COSAG04_NODE_231_length_19199_cov_263.690209_3_plen_54_part_00
MLARRGGSRAGKSGYDDAALTEPSEGASPTAVGAATLDAHVSHKCNSPQQKNP